MSPYLINFINLILCVAWGWAAVCRLSIMNPKAKLRIKSLYVFAFVASFFDGMQFFILGELAGWMDVLASAILCLLMIFSFSRNSAKGL